MAIARRSLSSDSFLTGASTEVSPRTPIVSRNWVPKIPNSLSLRTRRSKSFVRGFGCTFTLPLSSTGKGSKPQTETQHLPGYAFSHTYRAVSCEGLDIGWDGGTAHPWGWLVSLFFLSCSRHFCLVAVSGCACTVSCWSVGSPRAGISFVSKISVITDSEGDLGSSWGCGGRIICRRRGIAIGSIPQHLVLVACHKHLLRMHWECALQWSIRPFSSWKLWCRTAQLATMRHWSRLGICLQALTYTLLGGHCEQDIEGFLHKASQIGFCHICLAPLQTQTTSWQ